MGAFKYGGLVEQVISIVTSGSPDILVNSSVQIRAYTGGTEQTVVLPDAATMSEGQKFELYNSSTQDMIILLNDSVTTLAQIPAGNFLVLKLFDNTTTNGTWGKISAVSSPVPSANIPALNIDWSLTDMFSKTISTAVVFTFSNAADGQTITVSITAVGSDSVTWPGAVQWASGTPPTQTANKTDVYRFTKVGSTIYGSVIQNY